jgi:hypothetical protein
VGEGGGRAEGCFRILEGVRFGKGWAYRILARVAVGVGVRPPGRLGRLGRPAARPDCRSPGLPDARSPASLPPPPRPLARSPARPLARRAAFCPERYNSNAFTESEKVRFGRYSITWPTEQWAK